MMTDKIIQFEVWNECNNACKFCSNKFVYDLSDEQKIQTIDIVTRKFSQESIYKNYQRIGFIGGEFFQGQLRNPNVKDKFVKMFDKLNEISEMGYFRQIWICCTLISPDQKDLWDTIERISDKKKIWICTSYDTSGRFHTEKMLNQWKNNMKELKERFPEISINTTTILTGDFIEKYMSGEFELEKMKTEFKTTYFFKPPMLPSECTMSKQEFNDTVLENFFPKRIRFLEFLKTFKRRENINDYERLFDTHFRADSLVKTNYSDKTQLMVISRNKETDEEITEGVKNENFLEGNGKTESVHNDTNVHCRHNSAYSPYVDSDRCFYCDKEMVDKII